MTDPTRWAWIGAIPCTFCFVLLVLALSGIPWGWSGLALAGSTTSQIAGWTGAPWALPAFVTFSFCLLIQLALAIWVGIDANRRGLNGFLWGTLVFFTCIVGLVVYLIVTRSGAVYPPFGTAGGSSAIVSACGKCGGAVRTDYRVCPYCGESIGVRCPQCDRPVESGWIACPHCASRLEPAS
jgi:RNA polymerase subunit RPABC4/transcription elongation factor Spt4